jgi:hypothetical protein
VLVTLDSNVWEKMICPNYEEFQSDPKVSIYKKLNKYISLHNVQFVLSSTVFSLESIRKGERQSFFSNYTPDIRIIDDWNEKTHEMHLEISIGPNDSSFPVLNEYLLQRGEIAFKSGFKLIQVPRVGMPIPPFAKPNILPLSNEQNEKISVVCQLIEEQLSSGYFWIQKIFEKYNLQDSFNSIRNLPECEEKSIAKATAEWADGDSIAAHIGYGGDYFCTNDQGGQAGINSVMHHDNIAILASHFGLKVVSPEQLLEIFKTQSII